MRSEILGLISDTLTANDELSRSTRDNLPLPVQRKLPKKNENLLAAFSLFFWHLHEIYNVLQKNELHR